MGIAQAAIESVWDKIGQIDPALIFETPAGQSSFRLSATDRNTLTIATSNGNPIRIRKEAFENGLAYLLSHGHVDEVSRCEIRANAVRENAGPLSQATHMQNESMNIIYVLPILKHVGLVCIEPAKPSSTWLVV